MTRSTLVVLALVVSACGSQEVEQAPQAASDQGSAPAQREARPIAPAQAAQLQRAVVDVPEGVVPLGPLDESQRAHVTTEGTSPVADPVQP